jgi:hypothetical protein
VTRPPKTWIMTAELRGTGGVDASTRKRPDAERDRVRVAVAGTRRRHKKDRLRVKGVDAPWAALADRLVKDGFLKGWDCDNAERVCEAVAKFLRAYSS